MWAEGREAERGRPPPRGSYLHWEETEAQNPLEHTPLGLVEILFTNKWEGAYCTWGGRNGKKSVNRSAGAKKPASETIDRKGGGVGRSALERLGGEIQVCLGPYLGGSQEREEAESEPFTVRFL